MAITVNPAGAGRRGLATLALAASAFTVLASRECYDVIVRFFDRHLAGLEQPRRG